MDKKIVIALGIVVYLLSAFASFQYFSANGVNLSGYEAPVYDEEGNVVDTGPKTEPCPLNGQKYSKTARSRWEKRRPLGIMVQNNIEARPQSGVSSADVIHEVVAEGGITRFLAMYYCQEPEIVGSVRSARIYFIKLLQAYGANPLYGHVGGANTPGPADALGEIQDLDWYAYNDMDQFAVPFPNYWRDYDRLPGRATEHTVYTNTQLLWKFAAENRGLTNVDEAGDAWDANFEPYKFADDAKEGDRGKTTKINYGFWDDSLGSDYTVQWNYDATTNSYLRTNGGEPHIDKNTEKQLASKNVIVVLADESVADDGYEGGQHMLYEVIGSGDAYIFQNGQAYKGEWQKDEEESMMRFYNEDGEEIEMVRGQIWISVLPTGNKVDYGSGSSQ
jgi:hypothetical protein